MPCIGYRRIVFPTACECMLTVNVMEWPEASYDAK